MREKTSNAAKQQAEEALRTFCAAKAQALAGQVAPQNLREVITGLVHADRGGFKPLTAVEVTRLTARWLDDYLRQSGTRLCA